MGLLNPEPQASGLLSAATPEQYPNDALLARTSGFGYGTPLQNYINGVTRAQAMMRLPSDKPSVLAEMISSGRFRPTNSTPSTSDLMANAALAANRIPIAGLGFDPSKMAVDMSGTPYSLGGFYSPSLDTIWSSGVHASNPVHESIHRGITQLLNRVYGPLPQDVQWAAGPGQELTVRRIMDTQFPGVERGRGESGDDEIRRSEMAAKYLGLDKSIATLNDMAARLIATRQPMGPR